ncbi:kinase-like domain-containing protein [Globomyces pollinis-pini]|nr:kinase-like domain-containing protein [Globomyces pollinis-pini]
MGCGTSQYSKPGQITVNHFQISELISIGTFSSKVCIATRKSDKKLFAIKYISKAQSLTEKSLNCIISERKLLQDLKHPLINNIRYSFQNNTYLFIVTDYFPGGTLRFHLDNNSFQESMCVSIMAEICTALIYIHSKKIVHRDIKPENILLDSDGHAYITEFNVATIFAETKPIKSIADMAPEVLSGNGYLYQVDFWSLGIMLFELIFKERPFRSKKRAELIKIGKYTVPESPSISIECRSLISELLRLNPSHRIGCSAEGINKLKSHHFFNTIRWNLVDQKLTSPVFIPSKTILNYKTTNDVPEILAFDDDKRNKETCFK